MSANRTMKASVFSSFFSEPARAIEVYNAAAGTNYADGKNDLIEISDRIGCPTSRLLGLVRKLTEHDLLDIVEEGGENG